VRILRWAGRFWTGVLAVTVVLVGLLLGLRALLPLFDAPPALSDASPADRAAGVGPRARLTLHFDRPMNPRTVERALRFDPPAAWALAWASDQATLTISPTEALRPDTDYRLQVGVQALSRRFRALAQPIELRFRTAPAAAVISTLPSSGAAEVALDAPISIRFSRPIVPDAALMRPAALPELQFDPPLSGSATWLDPATVLFRPAVPLRPGTRYTATLAATLADASGGQLRSPYTWTFSTPAPRVLGVAPASAARLVAPRATLALTLSQPLDIASLRATLAFSPTIAGQLAATPLPDGGQLITLQPSADLAPSTTYSVTLQAGAAPTVGNLPLLQPFTWRFTTAPRPSLTGRFPGEGQTLPGGQEIRLVFSTPFDRETFRAALQITPPAGAPSVTSSGSEIRISADLRAATVYTMTLPATLADRNGIPLGQEYQLRFVTAPAGPALELPEVAGHLAQLPPDDAGGLLVRRTNLSGLSADLYQLDEAGVVRTIGFGAADWAAFQPERYGQPLLRSWQVALADPLNTPAESRVALTADGGPPLAPGAYYLRLRSLEGPRADLIVLVTRARLSVLANGPDLQIWATDIISGTPLSGLPVALYRAGALVRQDTTGPSGALRLAGVVRPPLSEIVAAAGGAFASFGGAPLPAGRPVDDERSIFVTTDRASYQPGDTLRLAGVVRATAAPSGTLALPPDEPISLSVRAAGSPSRIYQATARLGSSGVFSAEMKLAQDLPPGQYTASATSGGFARQVSFAIQPAGSPSLRVAVSAPPPLVVGEAAPLTVAVRTVEGLPVAGAPISWTLEAERLAPPPGDTIFGDAERVTTAIAPRSGAGQAGPDGLLNLFIADLTADDQPVRYRLTARVADPGSADATGAGEFLVVPAHRTAGLRLPSQIFTAGRAGLIELLAVDAEGQPVPRAAIRVEVYRRTWAQPPAGQADEPDELVPDDRLAFTRSAVTGADGRVSLPLTLPAGGAYRLRAAIADAGAPVYSAATVWATAPGFTAWGALPGGHPLLIADRSSYRPGDTATLLVTSPLAQASALVSRGGPGGTAGEVRELRAGTTFTITIQPDDPPELPIDVLLSAPATSAGQVATPPALPAARAILPVSSERQSLEVRVSPDRAGYALGDTATLTITTRAAGAGLPADIILSVAEPDASPQARITDALRSVAAPADGAAAILAANPSGAPAPGASAGAAVFWSAGLRTDATGVLTVTIPLPRAPAGLRAVAWAASVDRVGQADATLAITQPLGLRVVAPPIFRAGDLVELAAFVQNTTSITQPVGLAIAASGLQLQPGVAPRQRATVAPGATARVAWLARVLDASGVRVRISASAGPGLAQESTIERAIIPAAPARAPRDAGVALLREYLDPLSGQALDPARLETGQLVRVRLTIVSPAAQRDITIDEPIPAGAQVVAAAPDQFNQLTRADGRLTLRAAALAPGIVQYQYLLRLVAGGSYTVPAPAASAAGGASGVGNTMLVEVASR
jgi:hypothetical protein